MPRNSLPYPLVGKELPGSADTGTPGAPRLPSPPQGASGERGSKLAVEGTLLLPNGDAEHGGPCPLQESPSPHAVGSARSACAGARGRLAIGVCALFGSSGEGTTFWAQALARRTRRTVSRSTHGGTSAVASGAAQIPPSSEKRAPLVGHCGIRQAPGADRSQRRVRRLEAGGGHKRITVGTPNIRFNGGEPPCDLPAIEDCLRRLSQLASDHPRIAELDINPLIAHPQGEGCHVADIRIRLETEA